MNVWLYYSLLKDVETPYYYCVAVHFSPQFYQCLLPIYGCYGTACIYIYNYYVFLGNWLFYHYIISMIVSSDSFELKSLLSDVSMATPTFFGLVFAWTIFISPFTFRLYVSLNLKQVYIRHIIRFCLDYASLGLCFHFTFYADVCAFEKVPFSCLYRLTL